MTDQRAHPEQERELRELIARMPNAQTTLIQQTIAIASRLDLTRPIEPIDVARAAGFNAEDLQRMTMFMDPAFNAGKIYLAPDFVRAYLVEAQGEHSVTNFYNGTLRVKYTLGENYFELDPDNAADAQIIGNYEGSSLAGQNTRPKGRGGRPQTIFYAVSGRCFKELIMQTRTDAGKQLRDYYIRVEALVPIYSQLITFAQMIIMKQQMVIDKQKADRDRAEKNFKRIQNLLQGIQRPAKKDCIYIATSSILARQSKFKPGRTSCLRTRLSTYNSGRSEDDLMFFVHAWKCFDAKVVELMIRRSVASFADKKDKEMVIMPLDDLVRIIEGVVRSDEITGTSIGAIIDHFGEFAKQDPRVPVAFNISELESAPIQTDAASASSTPSVHDEDPQDDDSQLPLIVWFRANYDRTDQDDDRVKLSDLWGHLKASRFFSQILRKKGVTYSAFTLRTDIIAGMLGQSYIEQDACKYLRGYMKKETPDEAELDAMFNQ